MFYYLLFCVLYKRFGMQISFQALCHKISFIEYLSEIFHNKFNGEIEETTTNF